MALQPHRKSLWGMEKKSWPPTRAGPALVQDLLFKRKKKKGKRDRERLEFWVQCEGLVLLLGLLLNLINEFISLGRGTWNGGILRGSGGVLGTMN